MPDNDMLYFHMYFLNLRVLCLCVCLFVCLKTSDCVALAPGTCSVDQAILKLKEICLPSAEIKGARHRPQESLQLKSN